jgi:hypothetical protein
VPPSCARLYAANKCSPQDSDPREAADRKCGPESKSYSGNLKLLKGHDGGALHPGAHGQQPEGQSMVECDWRVDDCPTTWDRLTLAVGVLLLTLLVWTTS